MTGTRRTWKQWAGQQIRPRNLGRLGVRTVQLFCAVHLASSTLFEACFSLGVSMYPTLEPEGDLLLVRRCSRSQPLAFIERGDIVAASSPNRPRELICKRLLGLPGDTIWADPTGESGTGPTEWIRVPRGQVWLVGDNASNSNDSRYYGPVPINMLRGKVVAQMWPKLRLWRRDMGRQSLDSPNT